MNVNTEIANTLTKEWQSSSHLWQNTQFSQATGNQDKVDSSIITPAELSSLAINYIEEKGYEVKIEKLPRSTLSRVTLKKGSEEYSEEVMPAYKALCLLAIKINAGAIYDG